MRGYDIGLSALTAHQQALMTSGQNITNASTPGYHRQEVQLVSRRGYGGGPILIGSGVDVARINRVRDRSIEAALLRRQSDLGAAAARSDVSRSIENVLTPGEASVQTRLTEFFDKLEQAANSPTDETARLAFVNAAQNLLQSFSSLDGELRQLQDSIAFQLKSDVDHVNQLTARIAELNRQIAEVRGRGAEPNDLLDQRDQLVTQLAELVDVTVDERSSLDGRVTFAGGTGFIGSSVTQLEIGLDEAGNYIVTAGPNGPEANLLSGRISELLAEANEAIPRLREELGALASDIVHQVDAIHTVGIPDASGFDRLASLRPIADIGSPLAANELPFPVQTGDLYVSVTEKSTGERHTYKIAVDPSTDSLVGVAAKLDALSGLAAFADSQSGRLIVAGEGGYSFDFAGRLDSVMTSPGWTGTSQVWLTGAYTGAANDDWSVTVAGTGTVGVTPGLTAQVRDGSGNLIATANIGEGYEAGTPIALADGLSMRLSFGTVSDAESVGQPVVAQPDETGLLTALGVNSLFQGSPATGFSVSPDLLSDPGRVSLSRSGEVGDAQNAARILQLRTSDAAAGGSQSFVEELAGITADVGVRVQSATSDHEFLEAQTQQLKAEQQSVSGVNPDEEMLYILESQRAFQAAARYLTTFNETIGELMLLIR